MTLDFSKPVKFKFYMKKYDEDIIEDFSVNLNNDKRKTLPGDCLLETGKTGRE